MDAAQHRQYLADQLAQCEHSVLVEACSAGLSLQREAHHRANGQTFFADAFASDAVEASERAFQSAIRAAGYRAELTGATEERWCPLCLDLRPADDAGRCMRCGALTDGAGVA